MQMTRILRQSTEETLQKVKHETQTTQDTLSPEFIKDTRKFTTEYTPDFQYGNEISSVFGWSGMTSTTKRTGDKSVDVYI